MNDWVISDNFKTSKVNEVKNYFVNHRVKRSFMLPASPWLVGFYKQLVRTVNLSYKEPEAILCETEYVINCRTEYVHLSDDVI